MKTKTRIKSKCSIQSCILLLIHAGMFVFGVILILDEINIKDYIFIGNNSNPIYIYIVLTTIINGIIFLLYTPLVVCLMCCCIPCIVAFTLPIIFLAETAISIYLIIRTSPTINNNHSIFFAYILSELIKSILSFILWSVNRFCYNKTEYEMLDVD